jgi:hypothetical protein
LHVPTKNRATQNQWTNLPSMPNLTQKNCEYQSQILLSGGGGGDVFSVRKMQTSGTKFKF